MYEARQYKDKVSRRISHFGRTAIQRNFDEMGGNALFVSKNDEGKIGSIYFNKGRIRLIHPDGPKISLHEDIRRYIIKDSFPLFQKDYKDAHCKNTQQVENLMDKGGKGWSAEKVNTHSLSTEGRLFEVFFNKNGEKKGSHKSRGGVDAVPITLNEESQKKLYYLVKYSRMIASKIMNEGENASAITVSENIAGVGNKMSEGEKLIFNSINENLEEIKNEVRDNLNRLLGYIANRLLRRSKIFKDLNISVADDD